MKCSAAQNLFGEYLKGSLSQEEIANLEHHLHDCEECKTKWETYRVFFSDTQIEQDFPVPSQLNAKIKYTLQQAKNKKKIPFYRNKQVLSYATACCFLLMAGLFGTSHFEQMKEDVKQPVVTKEIITGTMQNTPAETPLPEPVMTETAAKQTPKLTKAVPDSNKTVMPSSAPETNHNTAELLADSITSQDAVEESQNEALMVAETAAEYEEPTTYARHGGGGSLPILEHPADFTVAESLRSQILDNYPHTKLSENLFSVQIPEDYLETLLGISIDTEESTTEYILEFIGE